MLFNNHGGKLNTFKADNQYIKFITSVFTFDILHRSKLSGPEIGAAHRCGNCAACGPRSRI